MTICTRKLWNCPILWLWGGSWRQYRSREIARWNQTGEPSATGSKRKKIYKPNKTPYPEIHQQGAEFCLALKRHSAHLPNLKNCLGVWGRLHCMSLKWRFCYSLAPFPLSQRGLSEGAERGRGEDIPSVPCSRGMGQEGKWLALGNDQEKLMYSSIHEGSGILYAFIKQDNLPVSLWHCAAFYFG